MKRFGHEIGQICWSLLRLHQHFEKVSISHTWLSVMVKMVMVVSSAAISGCWRGRLCRQTTIAVGYCFIHQLVTHLFPRGAVTCRIRRRFYVALGYFSARVVKISLSLWVLVNVLEWNEKKIIEVFYLVLSSWNKIERHLSEFESKLKVSNNFLFISDWMNWIKRKGGLKAEKHTGIILQLVRLRSSNTVLYETVRLQ